MRPPLRIWLLCFIFAAARAAAFFLIFLNQSSDALWQFEYLPLWIADFPLSLLYFAFELPIPTAEGIIGPIWWFLLPLAIWWVLKLRRNRQVAKGSLSDAI